MAKYCKKNWSTIIKMGRYNKFTTSDNIGYKLINIPQFKYPQNYTSINVNSSDRLDILAKRFYNDSTLWWIIALFNNLPGSSVFLQTEQILKIPNNISNFL